MKEYIYIKPMPPLPVEGIGVASRPTFQLLGVDGNGTEHEVGNYFSQEVADMAKRHFEKDLATGITMAELVDIYAVFVTLFDQSKPSI